MFNFLLTHNESKQGTSRSNQLYEHCEQLESDFLRLQEKILSIRLWIFMVKHDVNLGREFLLL